jgi:hypothetical protein
MTSGVFSVWRRLKELPLTSRMEANRTAERERLIELPSENQKVASMMGKGSWCHTLGSIRVLRFENPDESTIVCLWCGSR